MFDINVGTKMRRLVAMLPVSIALIFAGGLLAHDGPGGGTRAELRGEIQAISESTSSFTVIGQTIVVGPDTRIRRDDDDDEDDDRIAHGGDDNLPFSALQVGDMVDVEGSFLPDGQILADEVEIEGEAVVEQVEIEGTIQSVGTDSIVVAGITVVVDSFTIIEDENHNPSSFSSLQVGQRVEVKGTPQPDGSILASKIEIKEVNQAIKLEGTIQAIGDMLIVVAAQVVHVDAATILEGDDDMPIHFGDLKPGMKVEVEGIVQDDGSVLANKIEADTSSPGLSATGRLTATTATSIRIGKRVYGLLKSTKIRDRSGHTLKPSDLRVGMQVRVLYKKGGKSFFARDVRVLK
ncbi:MAG: hypothetical protein HYX75_16460 [Acidobacteria bacterium]|nr:hypothetical protein [Acidobacteriota bacterium]